MTPLEQDIAEQWAALRDRSRRVSEQSADEATHYSCFLGFVVQGANDRHLADDLTAEAFTRALAALPQLNYCGLGMDGWLITIARNLVTDHFRFLRTRPVSPAPSSALGLVDERDAEAAPEASVIGRMWLLAALAQLEPRLPEVVVRRILLYRSVQQKVAELSCHESKVKHGLRRAPRLLAALLLADAVIA